MHLNAAVYRHLDSKRIVQNFCGCFKDLLYVLLCPHHENDVKLIADIKGVILEANVFLEMSSSISANTLLLHKNLQ